MSKYPLLIKGVPISIAKTVALWDNKNRSEDDYMAFSDFYDLVTEKIRLINLEYESSVSVVIVNRDYDSVDSGSHAAYISVGHIEIGDEGKLLERDKLVDMRKILRISKKQRKDFTGIILLLSETFIFSGKYGIYNDIFDSDREYEVFHIN
jgi:hypothetical protein